MNPILLLCFLCSAQFWPINASIFDQKFRVILDAEDDFELKSVEKAVCEDADKVQIERLSTIDQLDKSLSCNANYKRIVGELNQLIKSNNDDLCGPRKLSSLAVFHKKYISRNKADQVNRALATPKILDFFFKHYAFELSKLCFNHFYNLRYFLRRMDADEAEFQSKELTQILSMAFNSLLYESQALSTNHINVKVRHPEQVTNLQHLCKRRFKPLYEQMITPILRLEDLGYTPRGEQVEAALEWFKSDEEAQRLYGLALTCEHLLKLRVFQAEKNVGGSNYVAQVSDFYVDPRLQFSRVTRPKPELEVVLPRASYQPNVLSSVRSDKDQRHLRGVNFSRDIKSRAGRRLRKYLSKRIGLSFQQTVMNLIPSIKRKEHNKLQEKQQPASATGEQSLAVGESTPISTE